MKNYFVEVRHGSLTMMIAIRGLSQSDVEGYITNNKDELECRRVTNASFEVISHVEGWYPTKDQIWSGSRA